MSRFGRILPKQGAYFVHVLSRVVNRDFVLGDTEKETFTALAKKLARFCGLQIVTYAVLDNHFHLLLHVPEPEELSDDEILSRLGHIWTKAEVAGARQRLDRFKSYASPVAHRLEREKYLSRMYDLGSFMKALKQQFTRWFNRRHQRTGTLWEARYKSVVIEGSGDPLLAVAAYIDLNAVRAGICNDPTVYRWCGYAEAVAGQKPAREGLKLMAEAMGRSTDWRMVSRLYRKWLYTTGEEKGMAENGHTVKRGFCREEVLKVWGEGGEVRISELLLCRIRYFSDGVAIGSRGFMDTLFEQFRDRFGPRRKKGGVPMKGSGLGDFYSVRNLQIDVLT